MATKVDLLKSFSDGQGTSLDTYTTYPEDHDTNYTSIETTVNQMVDELAAARLADALIPRDLIDHRNIDTVTGGARYTHDALEVTRSGNDVVIGGGLCLIKNLRISTLGDTISFSTSTDAAGTYYIPMDSTGLILNKTTTANSSNFDLVEVAWDDIALADNDITDNLLNDGQVLQATDQGMIQGLQGQPDSETNPFAEAFLHRTNPPIRGIEPDGTLGESGFFFGNGADDNRWFWVSAEDSSNDSVLGGLLTADGQQLLLEQCRLQVIRSTTQSINNTTATAIEWDLLPTANVAGDPERFEPESYFASTDFQSGTGNRDMVIPSSAALNGTYAFTVHVEFAALTSATYLDVHLIQTVGGTATIARERVRPAPSGAVHISLAGEYDFVNADEFQVQVEHDDGAAINLTEARATFRLVSGGV